MGLYRNTIVMDGAEPCGRSDCESLGASLRGTTMTEGAELCCGGRGMAQRQSLDVALRFRWRLVKPDPNRPRPPSRFARGEARERSDRALRCRSWRPNAAASGGRQGRPERSEGSREAVALTAEHAAARSPPHRPSPDHTA